MARWRFMGYLAGSFFTAGLAVIPQQFCLAVGFVITSIVIGSVAIYLYRRTRKYHQERINQLTKYIEQGITLTYSTPKTTEEYLNWKTQYTDWHNTIYSWLKNISLADATSFVTPRDRIALHYDASIGGGDEYQKFANTLRSRLENLRELLGRYLSMKA